MDAGMTPLMEVDDRSSSLRDDWREELDVKEASGLFRFCPLMIKFCRDRLFKLEGKLLPIALFLMSSRVVTLLSAVKMVSGMLVIAVDSKCKVDNTDRDVIDVGREPAGITPLPITCNPCKPVNTPTSFGNVAGTAGNVRVNEPTFPEPSHETPLHAQNLTSFTHSPFCKAVCPV